MNDVASNASNFTEKRYRIDRERSSITWTGSGPFSSHTGSIGIAEGELNLEGGRLTGRILIDMKSIGNTDLKQGDYSKMLVSHLLSEDFFEVERYPSAQALITSWRRLPGPATDNPNYELSADLTIKGITHPVSFPARIVQQGAGLAARATVRIDRTRWNVNYGSGGVLGLIGRRLVHNMITLDFSLYAE